MRRSGRFLLSVAVTLLAVATVGISPIYSQTQESPAKPATQDSSKHTAKKNQVKKEPEKNSGSAGDEADKNKSTLPPIGQAKEFLSDCAQVGGKNGKPCHSQKPPVEGSTIPVVDPTPANPPAKNPCKDTTRNSQVPGSDPCKPDPAEGECQPDSKAIIPGEDPCRKPKKDKPEIRDAPVPEVVVK
jgi:hypothetical protein